MRILVLLLLNFSISFTLVAQTVQVDVDEEAIARGVERGLLQLDQLLAKVDEKLDINIKLKRSDQINFDGPQKNKSFIKSFAAGADDKIVLANQYGSLKIHTWDKKEVKTEVSISAFAGSEEEAQKLLDEVNIDAGKQGDQIVFKTRMSQPGGNWGSGSRNGKRWRREIRVDYVVYMPASNDLSLSQNYGNVTMDDLTGTLYAKVQYGNFSAVNLRNSNNYISVQYGKTELQQVNKAVIKHQYGSGLSIGTVGSIDLDAQYAKVTINTVKDKALIKQQYGSGLSIGSTSDLDLDIQYANANVNTISGTAKIRQQYSSLTLGTVGQLALNAQYTSATIGSLKGNATIDMEYNKLTIGSVGAQCKSLNIDGDYLNINVGFSSGYSADVEVNTSYAAFRYGEEVTARLLGEKNSSNKIYRGKIGNGGPGLVKVKSDYGAVLFH